jgi:hypothetical protein
MGRVARRAVVVPIREGRWDGVSRAQRPRLDLGVQRAKFCEELALLVIADFRFEIHN